MKIFKAIALVVGSSILLSGFSNNSIVNAADLKTQDLILSSNGAAAAQDWEYNAAYEQGWIQYTINWQHSGNIQQVNWRCVDNCKDEGKFDYRVKFVNGKMTLAMRAVNKEPGLIRVQLTALVDESNDLLNDNDIFNLNEPNSLSNVDKPNTNNSSDENNSSQSSSSDSLTELLNGILEIFK